MISDRTKISSPYKIKLFFAVIFFSAIILSFMFGYFLPVSIDNTLRGATSFGTVLLAKLIGLEAFVEPDYIISIEGQRLSIVTECSAIGYIFIFVSAVVAFPSNFRKKLSGLFVGLPLIVFLNLFRIVTLGWVGGHYPKSFDIFHTVLWEGGFVVVIFIVWVAWLNDFFEFSTTKFKVILETFANKSFYGRLLFLILSISLLLSFADEYQRGLAMLAENLIHMLGHEGFFIRSDGSIMVIAFSGNMSKEFWAGYCYLLPFIVLVFLCPRIGRREDSVIIPIGESLLKVISGSFLVTLVQLLSVILFFVLLKQGMVGWPLATVDAAARLSPAIVWFFLAYIWKGPSSSVIAASKNQP